LIEGFAETKLLLLLATSPPDSFSAKNVCPADRLPSLKSDGSASFRFDAAFCEILAAASCA
jgi:hypothetical protein